MKDEKSQAFHSCSFVPFVVKILILGISKAQLRSSTIEICC
jgi:hypothetical protein